jgi:hypothetical protein
VLGFYLVVEAITTVGFVMLAAVFIGALGPFVGLVAWLLCLCVFRFAMRRLRRHVWN